MKGIVGVVSSDMSFIMPGFTECQWVYFVSFAELVKKNLASYDEILMNKLDVNGIRALG